jgi:DHA1 family inner membrane transport protein
VPIAILALALGALGIGLAEFAVMGLLPDIASDLSVSLPTAGNLVTAYAVGVVVGAPLLTVAAVRLRRRTALLLFMGLFAVGNGLAAVAPNFGLLVVARFLSGLPHGAFFGVGVLVAASLVAQERQASAVASMTLGVTVANVIGVPASTALGAFAGWRMSFVLIAGLGLLCMAGLAVTVSRGAVTARPSLSAEFGALRTPAVLFLLGAVVLGSSGMFAFYTFITPTLTDLAGFSTATVPILLMVCGLGMTVGIIGGGRLADRFDPRRVVLGLIATQAVLLVVAVFAMRSHLAAPFMVFGVGAVGLALFPPVQATVMRVAGDASTLASAALQSAFNIANALGAAIGGLTLAAGLGLSAPPAAGALLSLGGLVPAVLMLVLAGRTSRHAVPVPA